MPPLLTARTCWRAGWAVVGLGVVLSITLGVLIDAALSSSSDDTSSITVYLGIRGVVQAALPAGLALLVGSVVLRRVEALAADLASAGAIAPPPPAGGDRRARRTVDGAVDLDDADGLDDAVEHEPGVR